MYKITIKKTEIKETPAGSNWAVIGERLPGEEKLPEEEESRTERNALVLKVYGYTPPITKKEEQETEIYKQSVEDLDLSAVIIAINNLEV